MRERRKLTEDKILDYLENGVLVVENLLSEEEVRASLDGLHQTLCDHGVNSLAVEDESSARAFDRLSSTNGSGGVLDLFYDEWKFRIATNADLFAITQQLWAAGYCHHGETKEELSMECLYRWHPYEAFDHRRGFAYIDRVGYRVPTKLAQQIGDRIHPERKKKARALQRSLTPHLDCCPKSMYTDSPKWRPIQCFVSLTDNLEAHTGGFEAAKGFHREFDSWAASRPPMRVRQNHCDGSKSAAIVEAPCVGQYSHIRPTEDREVIDRVQHIPVRAGSAVFWDNRIPHANAYKHLGLHPRAVVYCSFLPDVELNRKYVRDQLVDMQQGRPPRDQWSNLDEGAQFSEKAASCLRSLSPLGRKLLGLDAWGEEEEIV